MKNHPRILQLLALVLALTLCLTGCTGGTVPPEQGGDTPATAAPGQTQSGGAEPTPTPTPTPTSKPTQPTLKPMGSGATIEETVLVDEADVKITATSLECSASNGAVLSLLLENNTDKTLSFLAGTSGYNCNSVNGYMIDSGYLNVDVSAGKRPMRRSALRRRN